MQFCDSKCKWCARQFWNWLKSREHQMNVALDGGTSFASAAATSVRTEHPNMATGVAVPSQVGAAVGPEVK